MRRSARIVLIAVVGLVLLGSALGAGPASTLSSGPSSADAAPPWRPFVACSVPGADGKPVAVILTPGSTPGSWVLIVGGTTPWSLAPLGDAPPVPPTPPVPPPPPSPTPAEAAKKLAVEAIQRLPQGPDLVQDAQKLAAVYKTLADQIPKTIDSIDKLIVANRYARELALGPQRSAVWEPWVKEIGLWLDAQRAAGVIKTVDDCKAVRGRHRRRIGHGADEKVEEWGSRGVEELACVRRNQVRHFSAFPFCVSLTPRFSTYRFLYLEPRIGS